MMIQRRRRSTPLAVLAIGTTLILSMAGCRSEPPADERESYVMAFLVTGKSSAEKSPEERKTVQAAHMANIGKLADEKKLVIAGPFGHPSPDDSMRGIFVFDTAEVAQAREWTETDPAVQAGVFGMELSRLKTVAPLRKALDNYQKALEAAGGAPEKVGMRGYAVVLAESGEKARAALDGLRTGGKIVFEGGLEGSERGKYVAVIDVADEKEARTLIDPIGGEMGYHTVFPWYATVTLLELKKG